MLRIVVVTYISPAETGLYYLQSRYYDPGMGRFLNADSQVSTGNDLVGMNMYAYCANNPVNNTDPSGCNWIDNVCGAISSAIEFLFPGSIERSNNKFNSAYDFGNYLTLGLFGDANAVMIAKPLSVEYFAATAILCADIVPIGKSLTPAKGVIKNVVENQITFQTRNAAFRAAKREVGVPMSAEFKIISNINKRGIIIPGKTFDFGGGNLIREHIAGHIFEDGAIITRHFNISGSNIHIFY